MYGSDPPQKDRRSSPRESPSYTAAEINDLRITRVHFRENYLFFLLSDGNSACVPLTISPSLMAAPQKVRYQWRITEDGKAVVWSTRTLGVEPERISLLSILAHPEAQISRV
jgi:hypothetical protein